jgi:Tfp pilus assembly protein PilN
MGEFDLNLSTRPFPAYRVTNLIIISILFILAVISAWQVYGFYEYSTMAADIRQQEQDLQVTSQTLAARLAHVESRLDRPEAAAKLSEIEYLNGVITRKNFSWTRIFAKLEELFPDNVHLLDVSPQFAQDGTVLLTLNVRGRNIEDVTRLIDLMEESPVFNNVRVSSEMRMDGEVDVGLTVHYYPDKVQE